jgi:hypothetical protein
MVEGTGMVSGPASRSRLKLRYFEDVLPVEFDAINRRRDRIDKGRTEPRGHIKPVRPVEGAEARRRSIEPLRPRSPDPDKLFRPSENNGGGSPPPGPPDLGGPSGGPVNPDNPDYNKTRPRPVPCNATGLAFSGGASEDFVGMPARCRS